MKMRKEPLREELEEMETWGLENWEKFYEFYSLESLELFQAYINRIHIEEKNNYTTKIKIVFKEFNEEKKTES